MVIGDVTTVDVYLSNVNLEGRSEKVHGKYATMRDAGFGTLTFSWPIQKWVIR